MKQTDADPNEAVRAVVPRIRNAATCPMFIAASDNIAPHYATFGGTNRDFHKKKNPRTELSIR